MISDNYDVFISYRRDGGSEIGRLLFEALKAHGLKVFFDIKELGSGKFDEKLITYIKGCKNFVSTEMQNNRQTGNQVASRPFFVYNTGIFLT